MDASNRARANSIKPIIASSSIPTMSDLAAEVYVDAAVMEYLAEIVAATRNDKDVTLGASMRGAMALARAAKTWALASGRTYVTPDDVRDLVERLAPIAQRFEKTGGVRDELLRLHRMAHTVINGANPSESSADDLWEVAAALIDEFRQMSDHCLEIAAALQPLADLEPHHDA